MSRFGEWIELDGLPAYAYTADPRKTAEAEWDTRNAGTSRRHCLGFGNRRLQVFADNYGTCALLDEHHGLRWICSPEPYGTGISRIRLQDGSGWSSRIDECDAAHAVRTFGPTWFRVAVKQGGLELERTVLCPEGEIPWVLVRVRLKAERAVRLRHEEEWQVRPRFLNLGVAHATTSEHQRQTARYANEGVRFQIERSDRGLRAIEKRVGDGLVFLPGSAGNDADGIRLPVIFGAPWTLMLEALGATPVESHASDDAHPLLSLVSDVELAPGEAKELWFRFGIYDGSACPDPSALYESSLRQLRRRLPSARSTKAPMAQREIPWHAAILTGQACVDGILGGHSLNQGSAYSLGLGFNGAARDPLQHALPLVYLEPDLALSVLRNTAAWGGPDGMIPWCIDGAKQLRSRAGMAGLSSLHKASDLSLWCLWLAAEYAAATGDLAAFDTSLDFHPSHRAAPVPLREHLLRHFRYLQKEVGLGPNGHLRVLSCDWADGHIGEIQKFGLDREMIVAEGESVLNSAMAAWVLPVWAGLCDRLGEAAAAREARALAEQLRQAVAREWNGRWFRRARCRHVAMGDDTLFLEVQPWAILSGAATPEIARELLGTIDTHLRRGSPLGARQRWPLPPEQVASGCPGEVLAGGIWPSLQMTLIWAAARHDPDYAWDEWRRFTLANHTAEYPHVWEGTLTGPDCYNAPESRFPGRSWALPGLSMQQYAFNNLHVHAQPLISYLRLLGVEPLPDGSLRVEGGAGSFRSSVFELQENGSGSLRAQGPVVLQTRRGEIRGQGWVRW